MPKSVAIPLAVPEFASADNNVNHGHEVYIAQCNKCHGYPAPDAVGEDKWPGVMDLMGKKARLSDKDTAAVQAYIMALREAGMR
jgi:mono/diheme cytochrome c family protein